MFYISGVPVLNHKNIILFIAISRCQAILRFQSTFQVNSVLVLILFNSMEIA